MAVICGNKDFYFHFLSFLMVRNKMCVILKLPFKFIFLIVNDHFFLSYLKERVFLGDDEEVCVYVKQ